MRIAPFGSPSLQSLNQLGQVGGPLGVANEAVLEEFLCGWPSGWIPLKAVGDKLAKRLGKRRIQLWGRVLGNEKEDLGGRGRV